VTGGEIEADQELVVDVAVVLLGIEGIDGVASVSVNCARGSGRMLASWLVGSIAAKRGIGAGDE